MDSSEQQKDQELINMSIEIVAVIGAEIVLRAPFDVPVKGLAETYMRTIVAKLRKNTLTRPENPSHMQIIGNVAAATWLSLNSEAIVARIVEIVELRRQISKAE